MHIHLYSFLIDVKLLLSTELQVHRNQDFPKTLNKYTRNTELSKDSFNQNLQLVKLKV